MKIQIGQKAPAFTLPSSEGGPISLKDIKDKLVVLYFYPKDDTPGCSLEAKAFKDKYWDFIDNGAVVLGVSTDDLSSHKKFIKKFDLPYPLLSDIDHTLAESYGVWVEKWMYGKKYWGLARRTFVIDKEGKITNIIVNKRPENHAEKALDNIKALISKF